MKGVAPPTHAGAPVHFLTPAISMTWRVVRVARGLLGVDGAHGPGPTWATGGTTCAAATPPRSRPSG
jgi:hypothetical protein